MMIGGGDWGPDDAGAPATVIPGWQPGLPRSVASNAQWQNDTLPELKDLFVDPRVYRRSMVHLLEAPDALHVRGGKVNVTCHTHRSNIPDLPHRAG